MMQVIVSNTPKPESMKEIKECDLRLDIYSLCNTSVRTYFGSSQEKRLTPRQVQDICELCAFVSSANQAVYFHELYKLCNKENLSVEEIVGEFQLILKEMFGALSKHKLGKSLFRSITVEDILNSESPGDILKRAIR